MDRASRAGRYPLFGRTRHHGTQATSAATESEALTYVDLVAGLIYLLMGGDLLVRGSVALARRANVSPMIVAASVVAFGTSVPELVVVIQAALSGYPGIVLGNVVGSNTANVLLVAGTAAAIFPLAVDRGPVRRDSAIMMGVTVAFVVLCVLVGVSRWLGLAMLATLAVVWISTAKEAARAYGGPEIRTPIEWVLGLPSSGRMAFLFILVGAVMLPVGASLVVEAAVSLAGRLGVTEAVIGLTVVAFSTSLPELATTVVAAFQRRTDVAVGTIVGSNVINILGIMGLAAAIGAEPYRVPVSFATQDLPVMLGATALLAAFVWRRKAIGRVAGTFMVLAYCAYMVVLFGLR